MDTITSIALSISNPLLKDIGTAIDDHFIYGAMILLLVLTGEKRDRKKLKILTSLLITALMVLAVKSAMAMERPCAAESWCPEDYSFPSMHAAIAFTMMTAFLNKKEYPAYLLFALFVGFTRLNLGVHVFLDVAGALPVALVSYYITDALWPVAEKRIAGIIDE